MRFVAQIVNFLCDKAQCLFLYRRNSVGWDSPSLLRDLVPFFNHLINFMCKPKQ